MTTKNDVTGDQIKSRYTSNAYRDNWDQIFKKKTKSRKDEADKKSGNDPL